MSKSELRELQQQQRALKNKIAEKAKLEIIKVLDKVEQKEGPGYTLKELAGIVFRKNYVSGNDVERLRPWLYDLKKQLDDTKAIVCIGRRYRYARTEEEIIQYNTGTILSGIKKVKAGTVRLPKQFAALGVTRNPQSVIDAIIGQVAFETKAVRFNVLEEGRKRGRASS